MWNFPFKILISSKQILDQYIFRAENDTLGSDYPVMRDGKWLWIKKEPEGDISQVFLIDFKVGARHIKNIYIIFTSFPRTRFRKGKDIKTIFIQAS